MPLSSLVLRDLAVVAAAALIGHATSQAQEPVDPAAALSTVRFVENCGQWNTPARFVAQTPEQRADCDLAGWNLIWPAFTQAGEPIRTTTGIAFVDPETPNLRAVEANDARLHFFTGPQSTWRQDVTSSFALRYEHVWNGIDVELRARDGRIVYDVFVAPHAHVDRAVFALQGVESATVADDGSLNVTTRFGVLRQSAPISWQVRPDGTREALLSHFRLLDGNRYGFTVEGRNASWPLVIDPGLSWATFFGGTKDEFGWRVLTLPGGDLLFAGVTTSDDIVPPSPGQYQPVFGGGSSDVYVGRMSPDGRTLRWSTYIGGLAGEGPFDLEVDGNGRIYFCGGTESPDYPVTPGAYWTTWNGSAQNVYLTVLDAAGGSLVYSTWIGGSGDEWALDLEVGANGRVTLAGCTSSTDFPVTANAFQTTYGGGTEDVFVAQLDPQGQGAADLVFATYLGGSDEDGSITRIFDLPVMQQADLVVDGDGTIIVFGRTLSTNFPVTTGSYDTTHGANGFSDLFVTRLSADGQSLVWSTFLGGSDEELAANVLLDESGDVLFAGATASADFPVTANAFDATHGGDQDGLVGRLSADGTTLHYASFFGGNGYDEIMQFHRDGSGTWSVIGRTQSFDFPATAGAFQVSFSGTPINDGFLARIRPESGATTLHYVTYFGSFGLDDFLDGTWNGANRLTGIGYSTSPLAVTPGSYDPTFNGGTFDSFFAQIETLPTGVRHVGNDTPGCSGAVNAAVVSQPYVGNANFAVTCSGAPASSSGLFVASAAARATALSLLGVDVWIDETSLLLTSTPSSDALGYTELALPLPNVPSLQGGVVAAQFIWASPCGPQGLSASNALEMIVQ